MAVDWSKIHTTDEDEGIIWCGKTNNQTFYHNTPTCPLCGRLIESKE